MPNVTFLDFESTSHNDLDLEKLTASCTSLTRWPDTSIEQRLEHIGNASIVISNKVVLDIHLLEQLQDQLELICIAATGTNNVDLEAAQKFNIPVSNIRDYASLSVAEHVMTLVFALARQMPAYHRAVQTGHWHESQHFCLLDYPITELAGKQFGIIGYGTLGQATAQLAQALGMNVLVAEQPHAKVIRSGRVDFDTVLEQADIISLHCPLTEHTHNLINARRLQQMKPSAFLINTARGGIVNELDLHQALKKAWIAGAALDVLSTEPPNAESILLKETWDNLIITPHIAWASRKARQTLLDQLAAIIRLHQKGIRMNQVV